MPQPQNIIGLVYDFDNTLSPHAMQEDTVLPYLGLEPQRFWGEVGRLVNERTYENELAWMGLLLDQPAFRGSATAASGRWAAASELLPRRPGALRGAGGGGGGAPLPRA